MKMLVSVTPNFNEIQPEEWIQSWIKNDENHLISGFEFQISDYNNDIQQSLLSIAHYFKKKKWEVAIKGPSIDALDLNLIYFAGRFAKEAGKKVVVSYTPSLDEYHRNDLHLTYYKLLGIRKIIREHNLSVEIFASNINYLSEGKKYNYSNYHSIMAAYNLNFVCDIEKSLDFRGHTRYDLSIRYIHLNKDVYSEVIKFLKSLGIKKTIVVELTQEELTQISSEQQFQTYLYHLLNIKEAYHRKAN